MTELILLLAMWPFRNAAATPDRHEGISFITLEPELGICDYGFNGKAIGCAYFVPEADVCDKLGKLYFYAGDDDMIGISKASCEAAKADWKSAHIDPVRMSRN